MQFNPVSFRAAPISRAVVPALPPTLAALSVGDIASALPSAVAPALPPTPPSPPPPTGRRQTLVDISKNLLKHIPGEASGFYLLAADSIKQPPLGTLGLIFVLALVLLVAVRWLADASRGVMVTTILAFLLWMLIFDKGFLHVAFPDLLPAPLGLIVAVFYSTLITILASAGKIR